MRLAFYSAIATLGALLLFVALTINTKVDMLISNTMISVAYGTPLSTFKNEILAIMSGGKLLIVPWGYQLSVTVLGSFLLWLGVQGFLLHRNGLSLRELLKKDYWLRFHRKLTYDPYE